MTARDGASGAARGVYCGFFWKNLGDGSPQQVAKDFQSIRQAIADGRMRPLDFGDLRIKRVAKGVVDD